MRILGTVASAASVLSFLAAGVAQEVVVDRFPLASGPPRFGESVRIRGGAVVWQRCWGDDLRKKDTIQFKNLSALGLGEVDVAPFPCKYAGIALGPTHLFWSDWDGGQLLARAIESLSSGLSLKPLVVGPARYPIAASSSYVFVRTFEPAGGGVRDRGSILAKAIERLTDPAPEAWVEVARFERCPYAWPHAAVSDRYFVWVDMNPDLGETTWRLYAKRMDELFVPGAERLVIDTKSTYLTVPLDLDGTKLVFVGALDPTIRRWAQLYLLDLDEPGEPMLVAFSHHPEVVALHLPKISPYYLVWTEVRGAGSKGLSNRAFGRRLEGGVPVGDPFPLSDGEGGAWLAFDRNIAVWAGGQFYAEGAFTYWGVMAAELPLPGATDLGDVDGSGTVNIADALVIVNYLFRGGPRPRLRLADANASGGIDVADAVFLLRHLFCGAALGF